MRFFLLCGLAGLICSCNNSTGSSMNRTYVISQSQTANVEPYLDPNEETEATEPLSE